MAGSSFGNLFKLTTFGESHGTCIGGIIDGCPPGIELSIADIQKDLDRRKPGSSIYVTQRKEEDKIHILSGIFEGKTTGTPIGVLIYNQDQRSQDYEKYKNVLRAGHADFTYFKKYGIRDYRGGGRASARETAIRVAAGAIAKKCLQSHGVVIQAWLAQIGNLKIDATDFDFINKNPFFCANPDKIASIKNLIMELKNSGDSTGAKITVRASGVIAGLGDPVFDKLDADLAKAIMSINAVKAVEIGEGTTCVTQKGAEFIDAISPTGFITNNAGGILGGISCGEDIIAHASIKPTSSIPKAKETITTSNQQVKLPITGRHDPCVGIRAIPIVEAMVALVIMDHWLKHQAQSKFTHLI